MDVQGAITFKKSFPESNFLAILPPSTDELRVRLIKRGTESVDSLNIRVDQAENDLQTIVSKKKTFSYKIVNGDLDLATKTFITLVSAFYSKELNGKLDIT